DRVALVGEREDRHGLVRLHDGDDLIEIAAAGRLDDARAHARDRRRQTRYVGENVGNLLARARADAAVRFGGRGDRRQANGRQRFRCRDRGRRRGRRNSGRAKLQRAWRSGGRRDDGLRAHAVLGARIGQTEQREDEREQDAARIHRAALKRARGRSRKLSFWCRLLARQVDGKLAVADAAAQAFGEGGGGVFAVGRDQLGERGEQTGLRKTIVLDPVEARLGPSFTQIRERDLLLFVLRHRLNGRNRMHQTFHCLDSPRGRGRAPSRKVGKLPRRAAAPRDTFRKG